MDGRFQLALWKQYADSVSFQLAGKALADVFYSFGVQILPVVQQALCAPECMESAHVSFHKAAEFLTRRFAPVLGNEPDVVVLLYFGLCSGAERTAACRFARAGKNRRA